MLKIENDLSDLFDHVKETPDEDINAGQFVELVTNINNLSLEKVKLHPLTKEIINAIWDMRKNNLYQFKRAPYITEFILRNILYGELSRNVLSDKIIELLKRIADIDLYITKEKENNPSFIYINEDEYSNIIYLYSKIQEEEYPTTLDFVFINFKGIVNQELNQFDNEKQKKKS
jgi:hypothetical protein